MLLSEWVKAIPDVGTSAESTTDCEPLQHEHTTCYRGSQTGLCVTMSHRCLVLRFQQNDFTVRTLKYT